jgi:Fur family zinc uptake transcriptional regulator
MPMAIDKDHVLDRVRAVNKSVTPQRMCVLDAIADSDYPLSAYTLQERLKAQDHHLNISTIYRVLDFWVELGVIHKIESNSTFVLCQDQHTHHLHVIQHCVRCHSISEACELSQRMTLPAANAFSPQRDQVIELKGTCSQCQAKA